MPTTSMVGRCLVLANRFGGVIFHEACGHLLETTQVERGTTPFRRPGW